MYAYIVVNVSKSLPYEDEGMIHATWKIFYLSSTRIWTQDPVLTRQALYYLSHTPQPILFLVIFQVGLGDFCLGWPGLWSSYLSL
jgi:hypothetical protein